MSPEEKKFKSDEGKGQGRETDISLVLTLKVFKIQEH
jgi:hypothetical protein